MITARQALENSKKHVSSQEDVYMRIKSSILTKIENDSTQGKRKTSCILPCIVFGSPLYDVNVISTRLMQELQLRGFKVSYKRDKRKLTVLWDYISDQEKNRLRVQRVPNATGTILYPQSESTHHEEQQEYKPPTIQDDDEIKIEF